MRVAHALLDALHEADEGPVGERGDENANVLLCRLASARAA